MAQSSKSVTVLKCLSSADVVTQNRKYVNDRRNGLIKSLKTKYPKLNSFLMGGIEANTILCISALSGGGKSALSKTIRDSLADLNRDQVFKQYIFNLEMLAHQQVARSIVSMAKVPIRLLYSVDRPLLDSEMADLEKYYTYLSERDISFIETSGNAETIANTIMYRWVMDCKPTGATLVYEIDHALLIKKDGHDDDQQTISKLMLALVDVKKWIATQIDDHGNQGKSIGIVLSQMNREIRKEARMTNADMHRPDTSCLFGSSAIEQACDYILFVHQPAKLGLMFYTNAKFPVNMIVEGKTLSIPYFELVKNRSGEPDITFPMWNKLKYFDFDEMEKPVFEKLHSEFIMSNCAQIPILPSQTVIDL